MMDYREMCCEVEPEKTMPNTVEGRSMPIKDQLIMATKKLIDLRSLLFNIVEGISSGQRADDKVPEAGCINDSARNVNMLIDQCMDLANGVHKFMF